MLRKLNPDEPLIVSLLSLRHSNDLVGMRLSPFERGHCILFGEDWKSIRRRITLSTAINIIYTPRLSRVVKALHLPGQLEKL
jgi:hypothetical protein